MRPYPAVAVLQPVVIVLNSDTQTGQWINQADALAPMMDRHKRSETSKETATKTSLDGNPDEGSDQEGDTD
jgi:putative ATP-grasp target RiPP